MRPVALCHHSFSGRDRYSVGITCAATRTTNGYAGRIGRLACATAGTGQGEAARTATAANRLRLDTGGIIAHGRDHGRIGDRDCTRVITAAAVTAEADRGRRG